MLEVIEGNMYELDEESFGVRLRGAEDADASSVKGLDGVMPRVARATRP